MRFLIDAPLSPHTAAWLTANGHGAVHVETLGLLRCSDEEIVSRAAQDRRLVITMDLDFPEIVALRHLVIPGIILIRLTYATPERVHERLSVLLQTVHPDTLTHAVAVLEDARFRIRKLPIE